MSIISKILACAVAAAIAALAGCSKSENVSGQSQQPQTTQSSQQSSALQNEPNTQSTQSPQTQTPQNASTEGFPENPSEASVKYFEDAVELVDKYLGTVMGSDDEAESKGIVVGDNSAIIEYLIDCQKRSEEYLGALEKLTPTEEMRDFHNGLLDLMSVLREYPKILNSLENIDLSDFDPERDYTAHVE